MLEGHVSVLTWPLAKNANSHTDDYKRGSMATFKAKAKITISDGSVKNKTKGDYYGSSVFMAGDEAALTAAQEKQYGKYFEKRKRSSS